MNVPCSQTPAGPRCSATAALRFRLPPLRRRRLTRLSTISRLNHTARPLAVYASQGGLLYRHARLASGWLANLSGRDWLPAGSQRKVSDFRSSHPPFPGFAWRTEDKFENMGAQMVKEVASKTSDVADRNRQPFRYLRNFQQTQRLSPP